MSDVPCEQDGKAPIPIAQALAARILIIDDEAPIRRVGRKILERAFHTVDEAVDGMDGLSKIEARKGNYDLVILDLTMPKVSGAEILRRIRTCWPTLPVLVWSGHSKDAPGMLQQSVPPDGYLNKPFDAENLRWKVAELLREARQRSVDTASDRLGS